MRVYTREGKDKCKIVKIPTISDKEPSSYNYFRLDNPFYSYGCYNGLPCFAYSIFKLNTNIGLFLLKNIDISSVILNDKLIFFRKALLDNGPVVETIQLLFPDVKTVHNAQNQTLLHYAAEYNNCDAISFLLKAGCDANTGDINGVTPLMVCGEKEKKEKLKNCSNVISLLLGAGAQINACDKKGRTAFFHACTIYNIEAMKSLLHNGADIRSTDVNGNTAFFCLTENLNSYCYSDENRKKCIDFLCENKIDINAINENGKTILHDITKNGSPTWFEFYKYLRKKGATPNIIDCSKKTPIDYLNDQGGWWYSAKNEAIAWEQWQQYGLLVKATGIATICGALWYYFSDRK